MSNYKDQIKASSNSETVEARTIADKKLTKANAEAEAILIKAKAEAAMKVAEAMAEAEAEYKIKEAAI